MTAETVLVEPSGPDRRRAFARWCLAQDPPIGVASATGSEVPVELFGDVPDEILSGAYIDGHLFRPVVPGMEPHGAGYKPSDVVPVTDGEATTVPATEPESPAPPRKRSTRKAVAQ